MLMRPPLRRPTHMGPPDIRTAVSRRRTQEEGGTPAPFWDPPPPDQRDHHGNAKRTLPTSDGATPSPPSTTSLAQALVRASPPSHSHVPMGGGGQTQEGGAPPPPQTKGTTVRKHEIYHREHPMGPSSVHTIVGPGPPPPSPCPPLLMSACTWGPDLGPLSPAAASRPPQGRCSVAAPPRPIPHDDRHPGPWWPRRPGSSLAMGPPLLQRLAVGGWRLVAVGGGWRLVAVGGWWRLVAVGDPQGLS